MRKTRKKKQTTKQTTNNNARPDLDGEHTQVPCQELPLQERTSLMVSGFPGKELDKVVHRDRLAKLDMSGSKLAKEAREEATNHPEESFVDLWNSQKLEK